MKTTNKNNNVATINNNTQKNMEEITMKNNNQNVTVNNTTSKEEIVMKNTNMLNMNMKDIIMNMTKEQVREYLEEDLHIAMSNKVFKKLTKDVLVSVAITETQRGRDIDWSKIHSVNDPCDDISNFIHNVQEEVTMKNNTQNTVANNNVVVAMTKEEIVMMTKDQIRVALEACGVEMSNNEFKRTKKADLVAQLEKYLDPTKKVEIIEAPVTETVTENKKEETVMTDKMKKYLDSKWDKLVKAVAKEYVDQSINTKFALFYKNTKATATNGEYLVKSSRLWGATSKAIKSLYGEKNCDEKAIRETLNAMVVRGYINYQKVQGEKGVNVIFNATAAQMNAMWKLSR